MERFFSFLGFVIMSYLSFNVGASKTAMQMQDAVRTAVATAETACIASVREVKKSAFGTPTPFGNLAEGTYFAVRVVGGDTVELNTLGEKCVHFVSGVPQEELDKGIIRVPASPDMQPVRFIDEVSARSNP